MGEIDARVNAPKLLELFDAWQHMDHQEIKN